MPALIKHTLADNCRKRKKMKPTVSVIVPTFNRAELIKTSVRSVLNQTYQDFEIIIIDDGSTDDTEKVVKNLNDDRIRYIRHERNKGAPAARNTGIRSARGKYLAFQDSDDEWMPEKLERQMAIFRGAVSDVGVVYSGFWKVKDNKRLYFPPPQIRKKEGNVYKNLLEENFVAMPSAVIKSECFKKAGMFDEELPRYQDWELFIRISKHYNFAFVSKPLLVAYHQHNGISSDKDALLRARKMILKKHFRGFEKGGRKLLSKQYYLLGLSFSEKDDLKTCRKYFGKALMVYPLNVKCFFAILLSVAGSNILNKLMEYKMRLYK